VQGISIIKNRLFGEDSEGIDRYSETDTHTSTVFINKSTPSRRDRSLRRKRYPHLEFHAEGMEPKRHISFHIQLFHTFGVVIVGHRFLRSDRSLRDGVE